MATYSISDLSRREILRMSTVLGVASAASTWRAVRARSKSGSLAIFAAIRRASSLLSSLVLMSVSPPKADID
jgi:hypothetical protein